MSGARWVPATGRLDTFSGGRRLRPCSKNVTPARIYAFFGDGDLLKGYNCSIYEHGDIPFGYPPMGSNRTLGTTVGKMYIVSNASAHGQKVPEHFDQVAHPFGEAAEIQILAEAATFIIRKTITDILLRGWKDEFKSGNTRGKFWLNEYGLNKRQSQERHKQMEEALEKAKNP